MSPVTNGGGSDPPHTLLPGEGSEFSGQGFEPQLPKGDYTLSTTWQDAASTAEYSLSVERLGSALGELEAISADGKGRVIFEEVDDLLGEQVSVVLRQEGQKVCEEQLNFGESWNAA